MAQNSLPSQNKSDELENILTQLPLDFLQFFFYVVFQCNRMVSTSFASDHSPALTPWTIGLPSASDQPRLHPPQQTHQPSAADRTLLSRGGATGGPG